MIDTQAEKAAQARRLASFMADARPRLERALVACFGVNDGLDAASEATAYAMEHWDRLQSMDNPTGYLYRVGQSAGRRLVGRWQRVGALVAEPRTSQDVVDVDLQRALLKLKPPERVAVVLVHAHGLTYREAADVLDMPVTTVTNHLNRGRKRLRRILEQ